MTLSVNPMCTLVLKTTCLFASFKEHHGTAQGARSSQDGECLYLVWSPELSTRGWCLYWLSIERDVSLAQHQWEQPSWQKQLQDGGWRRSCWNLCRKAGSGLGCPSELSPPSAPGGSTYSVFLLLPGSLVREFQFFTRHPPSIFLGPSPGFTSSANTLFQLFHSSFLIKRGRSMTAQAPPCSCNLQVVCPRKASPYIFICLIIYLPHVDASQTMEQLWLELYHQYTK